MFRSLVLQDMGSRSLASVIKEWWLEGSAAAAVAKHSAVPATAGGALPAIAAGGALPAIAIQQSTIRQRETLRMAEAVSGQTSAFSLTPLAAHLTASAAVNLSRYAAVRADTRRAYIRARARLDASRHQAVKHYGKPNPLRVLEARLVVLE